MVALYQKRPETVRAVKFIDTPEQIREITRFIDGAIAVQSGRLYIERNGFYEVPAGYWIVQMSDLTIRIMSNEAFNETYEPVR